MGEEKRKRTSPVWDRQAEATRLAILRALVEWWRTHRATPTTREVGDAARVSHSTAGRHARQLVELGLVDGELFPTAAGLEAAEERASDPEKVDELEDPHSVPMQTALSCLTCAHRTADSRYPCLRNADPRAGRWAGMRCERWETAGPDSGRARN